MRFALSLSLALLLLPTGAAPAATVGGKVRVREGTDFGTMTFRAGSGVANRVTVEPVVRFGRFRITDRAEPLRATGDCQQDGRHSALCPWTESSPALRILVRGKSDRVTVEGRVSTTVSGSGGRDTLRGNGVELFGGHGSDTLIGGRGWDRLNGGPGRDRVEGRGSSPYLPDVFIDGERDRQAARDVYVGGRNARATLDYSLRSRSLRIDLHDRRVAPERDLISGVKGLVGGAGDDRFVGTGGTNTLNGGPGNDRLHGRGGKDTLDGGTGDDAMYGEDDDDSLRDASPSTATDGADDLFVGGKGRDDMQSLETGDDHWRDEVRCDSRDRPVRSDAADRLRRCTTIEGWDIAELEMQVQPQLTAEGLAFTLRCGPTESEQTSPSTFVRRCRGTLTVHASNTVEYGRQDFSFEMSGYRTPEVTVTVPLTEAGRQAVERGAILTVEAVAASSNGWTFPSAGYRAFVDG